jgi:DNA-binding beta-propeller fold protein YncE
MSSMKPMPVMNRVQALWRVPLPAAVAVLLAAGLGLSACNGDNLFSGGTGRLIDGPPLVIQVSLPDDAPEGQQVDIRLRAFAPRGLDKVTVRYRRAVIGEVELNGNMRTDTVTFDFSLLMPPQAADTLLVIETFASDQSGRVSEIRSFALRVRITSAPIVTATAAPGTATPGGSLDLRVSAQDKAGLTSIGYYLLKSNGDTIRSGSIAASGTRQDMTFTIAVPTALQDSVLGIIAYAINSVQLRGVAAPLALAVVDQDPPSLSFLDPRPGQSYTAGSPIRVRLQVTDSASGLAEVRVRGVSFRNYPDSLQNATPVVRYPEIVVPFPQGPDRPPPMDTVLVRDLLPNADQTVEPVFIIAQARDRAGNIRVDTVRLVPGPRVTILSPSPGATVRIDSNMQVRLQAFDPAVGLDSVKLHVTGATTSTQVWRNLGGTREEREFDPIIAIGPSTGVIQIRAEAWNTSGALGITPQAVLVTVSEQLALDTVPPLVLRRVTPPARMELTDSLRVTVQGNDGVGSGIRRLGVVVVAQPDDGQPAQVFYRSSEVFEPARSGVVERTLGIHLGERFTETMLKFPRNVALQVQAYAVDADGNCAVAVGTEFATRPCTDSIFANGQMHYRSTAATPTNNTMVVAGRSVKLPGGGRIADAAVDGRNRRIYLSNIQNNKIDIFDLATNTFAPHRLVGAAPWGMTISTDTARLYVANSGGTNISVLPIGPSGLGAENDRLLTPNVLLKDLKFDVVDGFSRYTVTVHDFSDRPQFIAQDTSGTLVFSTMPTNAARNGTIRYITNTSGVPSVRIMHRRLVNNSENSFALAGVDSLLIVRTIGENDAAIIFSRSRSTGAVVQSQPLPIDAAVAQLQAVADVEIYAGSWDIPRIALGDTTFVANSANRAWIAFGEGAVAPFGRVFICCNRIPVDGGAAILGLSSEVAVNDLVNNASERVIGVGLNNNGSLGVARGMQATYYFSGQHGNLGAGDLRLQGEFTAGMAGGQGGATLHPQHAAVLEQGDRSLSFAATANRSIRIIDSRHFYLRGEILLRDNVVGPLRAFMPAAAENGGLPPSHEDYIVVKLLAVTAGDNVVVINVRRKDLQE